jgi:hypothetical protein
MKIIIDKKPSIVEAGTKQALLSKIHANKYVSASSVDYSYSVNIGVDGEYVRVYNLEKHRKKTIINSKGKKEVKAPFWRAYVYTYEKALLKLLKAELKQNTRNYTLKTR